MNEAHNSLSVSMAMRIIYYRTLNAAAWFNEA
jgi:hypothetical protein